MSTDDHLVGHSAKNGELDKMVSNASIFPGKEQPRGTFRRMPHSSNLVKGLHSVVVSWCSSRC